MHESVRQFLDEMEAIHNLASAQLRSLAEKRRHLEDRRQRILLQLEEPGDHSLESHRALVEQDRELDRMRQAERTCHLEAKTRLDALRGQVQATMKARREALAKALREAQAEADHLHGELIPEARRYLDDLENRHRSVHARGLTLANQLATFSDDLPDPSRFDLAE